MTNLVVLVGRLTRPAKVRVLPSGIWLVAYEVTVAREGERAESIPVVWMEAPARAEELAVDEMVTVVGRVKRRFFKVGGSTQSRTEVVAELVAPARQRKKTQSAIARVQTSLDSLCA